MQVHKGLTVMLGGVLCVLTLSGCSIRGYALRATADAMAGSSGGYGEDDDPLLVRDAAPFGLTLMETLYKQVPDHRELPVALSSGFTQYAYAFVQQEADRREDKSLAEARAGWSRARRLYLRARNYGLRGLDARFPGMRKVLFAGDVGARDAALRQAKAQDVPLLYWTAASWALAISNAKDDANLIGDLPAVEALMGRALALDEDYDRGAIHEFYVSLEGSNKPVQAKQHLDRALALSGGRRLGVRLSYAEGVLVQQQKKAEFKKELEDLLAVDIDKEDPAWRKERLANIVAKERARWQLTRLQDLFAD